MSPFPQASFSTLFRNTPVPPAIYEVLMPFDPLELALSQGEVKYLIRSFINARRASAHTA